MTWPGGRNWALRAIRCADIRTETTGQVLRFTRNGALMVLLAPEYRDNPGESDSRFCGDVFVSEKLNAVERALVLFFPLLRFRTTDDLSLFTGAPQEP